MEIEFSDTALSDLAHWKKSGNKVIKKRIDDLLNSIKKTPFLGIGKPEALKYNFSGYWSRRITKDHRIIYRVEGNIIKVISLRFHYND